MDVFRRQIALPQDHGAWVFLFSPLLIGLFAGKTFSIASVVLIIAALAAFLLRQPVSILVKVYSGRRPKRDLPAARFWTLAYSAVGLAAVISLARLGFGSLLLVAIPGAPVFIWHLVLVSRRAERRQPGVEILGAGVLALSAPAAYWVGAGAPATVGWWLFLLTWFQSAASIVYAYLRLSQRELRTAPKPSQKIRMAWRALLYTSFNLAAVLAFSFAGALPPLLPIPYAAQWAETLYGTLRPATGQKPTQIGLRQFAVSALFTLLFILTWR